jgi:Holliday junction resolvase
MTNYAKGAGYERKLMKLLNDWGYLTIRSAGSHSAVDIVSVGEGNVSFIQVKSSRRRIIKINSVMSAFKNDIAELAKIKRAVPHANAELWLWTYRQGWRVFDVQEIGNIVEIMRV